MPKQAEVQAGMPDLQSRIKLCRIARGQRELLGFADLTIGGAFVIKDICIVRVLREGEEAGEPFVAFPSKKGTGAGEGKYFDVAHPITAEARQKAMEVILSAYYEAERSAT